MDKACNITISGRVHNVGFRYATQKMANQYHIKGLVKNQTNGTVYIEAEGEEDPLNQFIIWCHQGPAWATVTHVAIQPQPLTHFHTFSIK